MKIKNLDEISVDSFRTSCAYTGALLDELSEQKLVPVKQKLVEKALNLYSTIATCGELCFQINDQRLFFWFNINETTKTISETLSQTFSFLPT